MLGSLKKMLAENSSPVQYQLPVGDNLLPLNQLLGETIELNYQGQISCIYCSRQSKKSFGQGYCYPCFKKLARCDMCIVKPEQCHFSEGTCREPDWGEKNCFIPHYVYLANSSGLKVGITRETQIPNRWIDQGAIQAIPILKTSSRYLSGQVEILFASKVSDKTNWRTMLKGQNNKLDMLSQRSHLLNECSEGIATLQDEFGCENIEILASTDVTEIDYPVIQYPERISSLNFDKTASIESKLMGIKGQYLIFQSGVINIRKFSGYEVKVNY